MTAMMVAVMMAAMNTDTMTSTVRMIQPAGVTT